MNQHLQAYITKCKKEYCCKEEQGKKIVFKDGKSATLTIKNENGNKIYRIKVDGCLIKDKTIKKCDFMACSDKNKRVVLIELKSESDLDHSLEQFLKTIETVELHKKDCYCILVSAKNFPKKGNKRQPFLQEMSKNFGKNYQHYTKSTSVQWSDIF